MKNAFLIVCLGLCLLATALHAQTPDDSVKQVRPSVQKFYIGTTMDAAVFSMGTIEKTPPGSATTTNTMSTLRFSGFLNLGFTFNYNFGRHVGIYTGIDLKNTGYIENISGYTIKRRTYNIGVPLGIRIGNMARKRTYFFLGGGVDFPFNYKEKVFQMRSQKTKIDEWLGNRTAEVMPYIFSGLAINRGYTFKIQYYPTNFLNPDFKDKTGAQPYMGTAVHLMLVSIGFMLPVSRRQDIVTKQVTDLRTM